MDGTSIEFWREAEQGGIVEHLQEGTLMRCDYPTLWPSSGQDGRAPHGERFSYDGPSEARSSSNRWCFPAMTPPPSDLNPVTASANGDHEISAPAPSLIRMISLVALSLSIGWGIRGNFGHEYGAMIPGALASLAAVLLSGRSDWHRRCVFFAFFGALSWSFGGSISYMQVIGYTHSGHAPSQLYGFACLFVIGFLWAAMGGAGAALPAFLNRERLTEFFAPLTAVFLGWAVQDIVTGVWFPENGDYRQGNPLYWYDTDWLAALVAIVAVLVLALVR